MFNKAPRFRRTPEQPNQPPRPVKKVQPGTSTKVSDKSSSPGTSPASSLGPKTFPIAKSIAGSTVQGVSGTHAACCAAAPGEESDIDATPQHEDDAPIVAEARVKAPLQQLAHKLNDGRSLRPLRDTYKKLSGKRATAQDAEFLKSYIEKGDTVLDVINIPLLTSWSLITLKNKVKSLDSENIEWKDDVHEGVLTVYLNDAVATSDYAKVPS